MFVGRSYFVFISIVGIVDPLLPDVVYAFLYSVFAHFLVEGVFDYSHYARVRQPFLGHCSIPSNKSGSDSEDIVSTECEEIQRSYADFCLHCQEWDFVFEPVVIADYTVKGSLGFSNKAHVSPYFNAVSELWYD